MKSIWDIKTEEPNIFQKMCQSLEWQSALIVYEKYKRKYNLEQKHLVELREYMEDYSLERQQNNKSINKDSLTQEASKYCKSKWEKNNEQSEMDNGGLASW
jgi:hypothetical protein